MIPRSLRSPRPLAAMLLTLLAACGSTPSTPDGGETPTLTLTVGTAALTLVQGATGTVDVTIARGGGFTGAVTVTAEGLPAGTTVQAATIAAGATTGTVTLTAGAASPVATATFTLRATGTGVTAATGQSSLTITAATTPTFTMAVAPTPLTIVSGQQGTATVTVTRGGGFAGNVVLTNTSPAGITVTAQPATITATQSTLTVAVAGGTAPGNYAVTLRGNAAGLAERTTTLTVTVTAPGGGGGNGNVAWTFCPASGLPLWVAAQDGNGAWTRVTGAGNVYTFQVSANRGGIAYVLAEGAGTVTQVFYGTQQELTARGTQLCPNAGATKTVNGSFSSLAILTQGYAALGNAFASATGPTTTFQLQNVVPGALDLIAARSTITVGPGGAGFTLDRLLTRRGVNAADGSTMAALDMNGAESFAPATATLTLNGANGEWTAIANGYLTTANSSSFATYFFDAGATGTTRTLYGVPANKQIAGDLHFMNVSAVPSLDPSNTATRNVGILFGAMGNKTVTFGPALTVPTITTLGTAPYARLQAAYPVQAQYHRYWLADFQQTGSNRHMQVHMTNGWLGSGAGSTAQLAIPDLSAVTGWNNAWGLLAGVSAHWTVTATGWDGNAGILSTPYVDGASYLSATKQGDVTP